MVMANSEGTTQAMAGLDEPAGLISACFNPAFFSPELSYSSSLLLPRLNTQLLGLWEGLDDSPVNHRFTPSTPSIFDGKKPSVCKQAGVVSPSKALY